MHREQPFDVCCVKMRIKVNEAKFKIHEQYHAKALNVTVCSCVCNKVCSQQVKMQFLAREAASLHLPRRERVCLDPRNYRTVKLARLAPERKQSP